MNIRQFFILILLAHSVCGTPHTNEDADGDGFSTDTDCNDTNILVHPTATESCGDNIDNNCDGRVDDQGECSLNSAANVWASGSLVVGGYLPAIRLRSSKKTLILTLCCGYAFKESIVHGADETIYNAFVDKLFSANSILYSHRYRLLARHNIRILRPNVLFIQFGAVPSEVQLTTPEELTFWVASEALDCKCPHDLMALPKLKIGPTVIPPSLRIGLQETERLNNLCTHRSYHVIYLPTASWQELPPECVITSPTKNGTVTYQSLGSALLWVYINCQDSHRNITVPVAITNDGTPVSIVGPSERYVTGNVVLLSTTPEHHEGGTWESNHSQIVRFQDISPGSVQVILSQSNFNGSILVSYSRSKDDECGSSISQTTLIFVQPGSVAIPKRTCGADQSVIPTLGLPSTFVEVWEGPKSASLRDGVWKIDLNIGNNKLLRIIRGDSASSLTQEYFVTKLSSGKAIAEDVTYYMENTTHAQLKGYLPTGGIGHWSSNSSVIVIHNVTDPSSLVSLSDEAVEITEATSLPLLWTVQESPCPALSTIARLNVVPSVRSVLTSGNSCVSKGCASISATKLRAGETGTWTSNSSTVTITSPHRDKTEVCDLPFDEVVQMTWTLKTKSEDQISINLLLFRYRTSASPSLNVSTPKATVVGSEISISSLSVPAGFRLKWSMGEPINSNTVHISELTPGTHAISARIMDASTPAWCNVFFETKFELEAIVAESGPAQYVCSSTATLRGLPTSLPADCSGTWSADVQDVKFSDAHHTSPVITNLPVGTTTLVWNVSCDSTNTWQSSNTIVVRLGMTHPPQIFTQPGRFLGITTTVKARAVDPNFYGSWSSNFEALSFEHPQYTESTVSGFPPNTPVQITWAVRDRFGACAPINETIDLIPVQPFNPNPSPLSLCDTDQDGRLLVKVGLPSLDLWAGYQSMWTTCEGATLHVDSDETSIAYLEWYGVNSDTCFVKFSLVDSLSKKESTVEIMVEACPTQGAHLMFPRQVTAVSPNVTISYRIVPEQSFEPKQIVWSISLPEIQIVHHESKSTVELSNVPMRPSVLTGVVAEFNLTVTCVVRREYIEIVYDSPPPSICNVREGTVLKLRLTPQSTIKWNNLTTVEKIIRSLPSPWWTENSLRDVYFEGPRVLVLVVKDENFSLKERQALIPGHQLSSSLFYGLGSSNGMIPIPKEYLSPFSLRSNVSVISEYDFAMGNTENRLVLTSGTWGNVSLFPAEEYGLMLEGSVENSNWNQVRNSAISVVSVEDALQAGNVLTLRFNAVSEYCAPLGSENTLSAQVPYEMLCSKSTDVLLASRAYIPKVPIVTIRTPTAVTVTPSLQSTFQYQTQLQKGNPKIELLLQGNSFTESCASAIHPSDIVLSEWLEKYRTCLLDAGFIVTRTSGRVLSIQFLGRCEGIEIPPDQWVQVRIPSLCYTCPQKGPSVSEKLHILTKVRIVGTDPIRKDHVCEQVIQTQGFSVDFILERDLWHAEAGTGHVNDVNRAILGGITPSRGGTLEKYITLPALQARNLQRINDTVLRVHFPPWAGYVSFGKTSEEFSVTVPSNALASQLCVTSLDKFHIYSESYVEILETKNPLVFFVKHVCSNESMFVTVPIGQWETTVLIRGIPVLVQVSASSWIQRIQLTLVSLGIEVNNLLNIFSVMVMFYLIKKQNLLLITAFSLVVVTMPQLAMGWSIVPWVFYLYFEIYLSTPNGHHRQAEPSSTSTTAVVALFGLHSLWFTVLLSVKPI